MTQSIAPLSLEVAVCTTSDPVAFESLQTQVHRDLGDFPGRIDSVALRCVGDPSVRADLVLWRTLDVAKSASATFPTDPRFAEFMAAVKEVSHFAHYAGATEKSLARLKASPIVEIAAYGVREPDLMCGLQRRVHDALRQIDGAEPAIRGVNSDDGTGLLDVIGWPSRAAHDAAPKQLMERHPELKEFFSGVATNHVFELFEVLS